MYEAHYEMKPPGGARPMSRAENRRRARNTDSRGRRGPGHSRHPAWILAASAGAAFLVLAVISQVARAGALHPTPRVVEIASDVVPAARYAGQPRARQAYRMAAAVPRVLDGLYCYCHCSQHSGHYSLLDCFASDHAAGCDVCMSEAEIAHERTREGASLRAIRAEVDRTYGA